MFETHFCHQSVLWLGHICPCPSPQNLELWAWAATGQRSSWWYQVTSLTSLPETPQSVPQIGPISFSCNTPGQAVPTRIITICVSLSPLKTQSSSALHGARAASYLNIPPSIPSASQKQTNKQQKYSSSKLGEGNGNPFQYSCLENSMDKGTWQATKSIKNSISDTDSFVVLTCRCLETEDCVLYDFLKILSSVSRYHFCNEEGA